MIKQTYDELVQKIVETSKLGRPEVEEKINSKLKQLSGLISKEGAAHIVANQLGIKLVEQTSGKLQIKNILVGLRDVEAVGKVMSIYPVREFQVQERTGKVGSLLLGDETGTIRLVLWGDQANNLENIQQGMIIKVKGAYVKEQQNGQKEIHLSTRGVLIINPPGETVGAVKIDTQFSQQPASTQRKKLNELADGDTNIDVIGTIVQVFEPRFYEVCPECGRRVLQKDSSFFCDVHNAVEPAYSYVLNLFLDDGTDNVRIVCFRNQVLQVLGLKNEEILKFRDSLEGFEAVRTAILGNITKFSGKAVRNKMFDRLEFVANSVDMNPDPDKELELLKKEMASKAK